MKRIIPLIFLLFTLSASAQENLKFLDALKIYCGKSYAGAVVAGGQAGDGLTGEKLVISFLKCTDTQVSIPFFAGENKSRTWIITVEEGLLRLKHDHRTPEGTPDKITDYGGRASNTGSAVLQIFPADPYTCNLIPYACANVWSIKLENQQLTYQLRRIGSDREISVVFDLSKEIEYKEKPWGWQE
jgi:hypothetical protein